MGSSNHQPPATSDQEPPMRTLSADLLAAQRGASAEPHVDVVVENSVGGMRRRPRAARHPYGPSAYRG
jgi:hypothetical protein